MNDVLSSRVALEAAATDAGPRRPSGAWLARRHLHRRFLELSLAEPLPETVSVGQAFLDLDRRHALLLEVQAAEAEDSAAQELHEKLDVARVDVAISLAVARRRTWAGQPDFLIRP